MGFPIKTSDADWLEHTLKLFQQRIGISITNDAGYNLNLDSDTLRLFKRFTLSRASLIIYGAFYLLSTVSLVLLYYSVSLQFSKGLGVTLSLVSFIVSAGIPTYFLVKNKAPRIIQTKRGIDIIFSNRAE